MTTRHTPQPPPSTYGQGANGVKKRAGMRTTGLMRPSAPPAQGDQSRPATHMAILEKQAGSCASRSGQGVQKPNQQQAARDMKGQS